MAIEATAENFRKYVLKVNEIKECLNQIQDDTRFHSNPRFILEHPDYGKLVSMGDIIIPYIIQLATEEGASWVYFHLLHDITGENPIKEGHQGRFIHILIDWLSWYIESKYYPSDIYNGLVTSDPPNEISGFPSSLSTRP